MSLINVEIQKDQDGFPTHATLNRNGRLLSVTYNPDGLISFNGRMHEDFKPILQMIWPFESQPIFNIPNPLPVSNVQGGNVLLFDDMEALLKWNETIVTVAADNTVAYNGGQSLILTTNLGAGSQADRSFPLPTKKYLTLEAYFTFDANADLDYIALGMIFVKGNRHSQATVRYDPGQVSVYNAAGGTTNVYPVILEDDTNAHAPIWHKLRYTIDIETGIYTEVSLGGVKLNVPNINYPIGDAAPETEQAYVWLACRALAGVDVVMHVDDVLIMESD